MSVDWNSIGVGCIMTAITHPFTYTKVLVQVSAIAYGVLDLHVM